MMTDPIADMLTRIRNAAVARHKTVRIPKSKLKLRIAEIMNEQGFIESVDEPTDSHHPMIELTLRYIDDAPLIQRMTRESRPGRRIYVKTDEIPRVRNGLGVAIMSTSNGVMTGREASDQHVGGELLCTIY